MPNGFQTYGEEWMDEVDDCGFRLLSHRKVKAKKEHICAGCQGFIKVGEVYQKEAFVTEFGFGTEKRHTYDCCDVAITCKHDFSKTEAIRNWEGEKIGETLVCSKCGVSALEETLRRAT